VSFLAYDVVIQYGRGLVRSLRVLRNDFFEKWRNCLIIFKDFATRRITTKMKSKHKN